MVLTSSTPSGGELDDLASVLGNDDMRPADESDSDTDLRKVGQRSALKLTYHFQEAVKEAVRYELITLFVIHRDDIRTRYRCPEFNVEALADWAIKHLLAQHIRAIVLLIARESGGRDFHFPMDYHADVLRKIVAKRLGLQDTEGVSDSSIPVAHGNSTIAGADVRSPL